MLCTNTPTQLQSVERASWCKFCLDICPDPLLPPSALKTRVWALKDHIAHSKQMKTMSSFPSFPSFKSSTKCSPDPLAYKVQYQATTDQTTPFNGIINAHLYNVTLRNFPILYFKDRYIPGPHGYSILCQSTTYQTTPLKMPCGRRFTKMLCFTSTPLFSLIDSHGWTKTEVLY